MPEKILLIDDDVALSTAWRVRLSASGYEVSTAFDGATGLQAARSVQPDLIILDIRMPGMDGFAVCRQLRADPDMAKIPVLFMSANVQDEARRKADELGAGFLPKPLDAKHVLAAVRSALNGKPTVDAK